MIHFSKHTYSQSHIPRKGVSNLKEVLARRETDLSNDISYGKKSWCQLHHIAIAMSGGEGKEIILVNSFI